jgi:hypothetical protein
MVEGADCPQLLAPSRGGKTQIKVAAPANHKGRSPPGGAGILTTRAPTGASRGPSYEVFPPSAFAEVVRAADLWSGRTVLLH